MFSFLFRWLFRSAVLGLLARLLGRFLPILRRLLRLMR